MNKPIAFLVSIAAMLFAGCGLVSLMGTPSRYEKKIPAEYDISAHAGQKILVLVEQPSWLNAHVNMRYYLTKAFIRNLTKNTKLHPENFVTYQQLTEYRASRTDLTSLSPRVFARALKAELILYVVIETFEMNQPIETAPYSADLRIKAILLETDSGKKLWPAHQPGKTVNVGFDLGPKNFEIATTKLAASAAHCTVRYLYNCKKAYFKIADDRSYLGWENW